MTDNGKGVGLSRFQIIEIFGKFPADVPDNLRQFAVRRNGTTAITFNAAQAMYDALPKCPTKVHVVSAGGKEFPMIV